MQKQHVDGCNEANHRKKAEEHRNLALSQESKEVQHSMLHVSRLSEKKKDAESEIAQLLSPPQVARNEAEELALLVEESNAEEMAHKLKLQPLERGHPFDLDEASSRQASTDLGDAKEQLRRLRLDMAAALASKPKAGKEVEDSSVKADKYSSLIEEIKKEIARSTAEEALATAAQVEADEGFREVEAQREAEAARFSKSIEETDIRKYNLQKEIDNAMKLQTKLETTDSYIDALQNEMKVIRAMNKNLHTRSSTEGRTEKEMNCSLQSAKGKLAMAKKKLESLKEEGFKLMSEMDDTRRELQQIADQKEKSSRIKYNSDSIIEHLNHKLRNSRSKLEAASFSEKRAEAIVSNISAALQQLRVDIEAAKIDTEMTCEAIKAAKTEIERTKHNVLSMEQRLQRAMRDLKEGIAFEDLALEKLRTISGSTTSDRAFSSPYNSSMTISKFECYYLIKQARTAQEIANQKVAAAQAWIEAPTADAAHQRRLSILRKGHVYVPRRSIKTKVNAHDLNLKLAIAIPRRSVTVNRVSGTYRRSRSRRASVSSGRQPPTEVSNTCLAGSTRKNIMLKIVRFLGGGSGSGKQP